MCSQLNQWFQWSIFCLVFIFALCRRCLAAWRRRTVEPSPPATATLPGLGSFQGERTFPSPVTFSSFPSLFKFPKHHPPTPRAKRALLKRPRPGRTCGTQFSSLISCTFPPPFPGNPFPTTPPSPPVFTGKQATSQQPSSHIATKGSRTDFSHLILLAPPKQIPQANHFAPGSFSSTTCLRPRNQPSK